MTDRERFNRYVQFQTVDRWPRWEWSFRGDTTQLWYEQGFPTKIPGEVTWIDTYGLDRGSPWLEDSVPTAAGVSIYLRPGFGDQILAEDAETVTRRDGWGAVARHSKMGASIPQYLSFGVHSRQDFAECRKRWDPTDPGRYPADWQARTERWRTRDYPIRIHTHGWYGLLRELMGVEGLSVAFFDQPELIEEVCEFWGDFLIATFDRALADCSVDYALFWEDLAYKTGPLLSPALFRRFFLPHYQRVISHWRARGVRTFMVDSDGNIDLITPLWLEAGVNVLGPYEVAAGMDVVKIGQTWKDLVMVGGIDKREIAKGPKAIEQEVLRRVPPLLERGGYIPTLDHATIPEMSFADYRYYREFLTKVCEG
jgi:uroporphyrinogen decarboxylase